MYAENTGYFSSGVVGGTTGAVLAAAAEIRIIAAILIVVTAVFTALLVFRLTRRGLRALR
jgi:hypothetical protein